jgi:hypothetical protein
MSSAGVLAEFPEAVHVIGVGGIGSNLVLPLARTGVQELHLWDPDLVEAKNLEYQHTYRESDIGRLKVSAMAAYLERQEVTAKIVQHAEKVTSDHATELSGLVLAGVDSMEARVDIFESVWYNPGVLCYWDGRTGGPQFDCFRIEPNASAQVDFYRDHLWSDEEVAALPCGGRDDSESSAILARIMTRSVTRFAAAHLQGKREKRPKMRIEMHIDGVQHRVTRLDDDD